MIVKTQYWLQIVAADHEERALRAAGKWQCFDDVRTLHSYCARLNSLVEDGTLLAAKVALEGTISGSFSDRPCELCVFTSGDREEIQRVAESLMALGLSPVRWKSERQTRDDWLPGGKLRLAHEITEQAASRSALPENAKPASKIERSWDVFISKNTKDLVHAEKVYRYLTGQSFRVFLSEVALPRLGIDDYAVAIDHALEHSNHLVVVTSAKEHLASGWVSDEWRGFLNERRSGRKSGNLITILAGNMSIEQLPVSLRSRQVLPLTDRGLNDLIQYLR